MQMGLTEEEVLAAKIAMIRKYVKAKPAKGTAGYIIISLMEYEDKLTELFQQEMGEYRHYPGDYWEPPTDELVNEESIEYMAEEAIDKAARYESWNDLEGDDKEDMAELLEDYDEVVQADYDCRMAGTVWGYCNDIVRTKSAV